MTTALEGLRILEIGPGEAAAMTGMLLAENGAEVVKVERPTGSRDRHRPGRVVWDRGKRSVAVDLETASGRARFDELVAGADGVVLALRAPTAERLGLGTARLRAVNPRLVVATISGFGRRGPLADLPGTEGMVAARTGRMANTAGPRPGPIFPPVPIASFGAATLTVLGLLAEIWSRDHGADAGAVHTSLLHALSVYDMTSGYGNLTHRAASVGQVFAVMRIPFMTAPTKDGRFIQMCSRTPRHFRHWLRVLDLEWILDEPDLPHLPDLCPSEERLEEIAGLLRDAMRTRTRDEWMDIFAAEDVGGDPFLSADEYLEHPQCLANGRSQTVVDPVVGRTLQIGPLGAYSDTPSVIGAPAPALGADADTAFREPHSGRAAGATAGGNGDAGTARRPLDGVTVVECGYYYATPFAATLLAEAGARVIKVEPNEGDPGRRNWTTAYQKAMVGKESIVLDLKSSEGRAIMDQLVDRADVFIHNFRPGTPERLDIGYDRLIARNPRLVYVYGSCFGSSGPWAQKAGFHSSPNAIAGAGIIEAGDGNPPINRTYADPASALATAACVMIGLHARERTGRGQYLETVMLTSMAYTVSEWSLRYDGKVDRVVDQGQHGFGPLHRLYETADGWLYLECHNEDARAALAAVLGDDVVARGDADAIGTALRARGASEWERVLLGAGVPAVRADDIDFDTFMLSDEQSRADGVVVETEQPGLPRYWRAGPAIEFERAPTPLEPSDDLGGHTVAILTELGYAGDEIAALEARGVTRAVGHGLPG